MTVERLIAAALIFPVMIVAGRFLIGWALS